jgi:hypothetical protein
MASRTDSNWLSARKRAATTPAFVARVGRTPTGRYGSWAFAMARSIEQVRDIFG